MKHSIAAATLATMLSMSPAIAADDKAKVEPGRGPTEALSEQVPTMKPAEAPASGAAAATSCQATELDTLTEKAKGISDAKAQSEALAHLDMARKSMSKNDAAACATHLKQASTVIMSTSAPATRTN